MLNAIHGVDKHGVKLYARFYTLIEALCSFLHMELSFTLHPVH